MASLVNAALCAIVAIAFWSLLGYALARHLFPRSLAIGAAPVLGWAVHSAAALPIFFLIGFSPTAVVVVSVLCMLASGGSLAMRSAKRDAAHAPTAPAWSYAAAAILALVPAAAILPKFGGDAVYFAGPIFDHSKVAIIDAMARQGLPPVNPVFGELGAPGRLAYYYLWHFSAAELALPLRASGWEADIGLTWFTAFASLSLMMALAVWLSNKSGAAILVVVLAAAASLRVTLNWIFDPYELALFTWPPNGFGGWLFQSAWVPQHLMSATCVVTAMLLVARYAQRPSVALLLTLVLTVVAGFESSTYVGGVTFAIAALAAAPVLLAGIERAAAPSFRRRNGGCRRAGRLPHRSVRDRSIGYNRGAPRWHTGRHSSFCSSWRDVSATAAGHTGSTGLLAGRTADRISGYLRRRRDRAPLGAAANHNAAAEENRHRRFCVPSGCGPRRLVASRQHAWRHQRSGATRRSAGGDDPHRASARRG